MTVRSYRDLLAWQDAMNLAEQVYHVVSELPDNERFELSRQLRGAAVSVPSNIVEGYARGSPGSYAQFLKMARGSLREIETQLLLAQRLHLCPEAATSCVLAQCDRVGSLLHGLIRSIDIQT